MKSVDEFPTPAELKARQMGRVTAPVSPKKQPKWKSYLNQDWLKQHKIQAGAGVLFLVLLLAAMLTWNQPPTVADDTGPRYAQCPDSFIDTGDADWVTSPLLHGKGGEKTTPFDAKEHLIACGVTFVRDARHRDKLIATGELVRLQGAHIKLRDIDEPFVTPLMLVFSQRLAEQYHNDAGCGDLVFTSALRNQSRVLGNGSSNTVHPTGMAIDLYIPTDIRCLTWLQDTLLAIERDGRVDYTRERNPPHFHVVLIPWAYQSWLLGELGHEIEPRVEEVRWLAKALYFEGAVKEPEDGLHAIASVIKNRRDSVNFGSTIAEVVAQGSAGRFNGGCQFSFMCDSLPEQPSIVCDHHPRDMARLWGKNFPCARRWAEYYRIAEELYDAPDSTGGAVLYYTGRTPWWAKGGSEGTGDMVKDTIEEIGGHIFACSRTVGRDMCDD